MSRFKPRLAAKIRNTYWALTEFVQLEGTNDCMKVV